MEEDLNGRGFEKMGGVWRGWVGDSNSSISTVSQSSRANTSRYKYSINP